MKKIFFLTFFGLFSFFVLANEFTLEEANISLVQQDSKHARDNGPLIALPESSSALQFQLQPRSLSHPTKMYR